MNDLCFFISDLHGRKPRYEKLLKTIKQELPKVVLMGGDLLPNPRKSEHSDFLLEYFARELSTLKEAMNDDYPYIGLILGNDDARINEESAIKGMHMGLWDYLHFRRVSIAGFDVIGYSYVPPTPFLLKDWERYDVSRFVDPGCIPPTEGKRTIEISMDEAEYSTIQKDLELLTEGTDGSKTIFLFHSPPYQSLLDRAGLDGQTFDRVPLDVHVGSIAIQRFIEAKQPYLTLHGHIHESSRITGHWRQSFGSTHSFSAAWDGDELALISFQMDQVENAQRRLL